MESYLELEKLSESHTGEVCIFGAGYYGKYVGYDLISAAGFSVDFYCDNYVATDTVIRDNIRVKDIKYLYEHKENILVFLCMKEEIQSQVLKQFKQQGICNVVLINWNVIRNVLTSIDAADASDKKRYWKIYDDAQYLKFVFRYVMGYELNLDKPKTFNEKMQWLKINDRNPEYTKLVDKYETKKYVAEILGNEYVIPTIDVWNSVDDIEWEGLPNQFVLKCTHDSSSVIICKEKSKFDIKSASEKLNNGLKYNFFWTSREWPYKNVKPRIIAEQYMQDGDCKTLNVYKIFNFHGIPKLIQVIQNDKTPEETIDYFDTDWNLLDLRQSFPNSEKPLSRPQKLEEMLSLARKLSEGIPFVRTDFYVVNGKVYFSEFTFFSDGGMAVFHPEKWDKILGEWI